MAATNLLSDSHLPGVREPPATAARDEPHPPTLLVGERLFDQAPDPPDADQSAPLDEEPGLQEEPRPLEAQLADLRAELDHQRAIAAEWEERCRAVEVSAARDRRAAEHEAEYTTSNLVRAHAMAVADRNRALAQHEEAVAAREAAVRTRERMEAQRDEAIAQREAAEARRDEAIAQRDDARKQREALHAAHRALRKQLKTDRSHAAPTRSPPPRADTDATSQAAGPDATSPADADATSQAGSPAAAPRPDADATLPADSDKSVADAVIPASPIAAQWLLTGGQAERHSGLTRGDQWAIRFFGTVGALCFIALLAVFMKALAGL
jgi:hypothetical protein